MKSVLFLTIVFAGNLHAAKWTRSNNPHYFNPVAKTKMNVSLAELPLSANLKDNRFGWSETYWPSNRGGIAYRWNKPNPEPFKYKLYTKEELIKMSEEELNQLSPAELYDIAMGDYRYSLTKKVLGTYHAGDLWWEGICHGWALAASNYAEPAKVVITNKDGIHVPFGASDVKGLLSMHDAFNSQGVYVRVGDRCSAKGKVAGEALPEDGPVLPPTKKDAEESECMDVNAGTFHIVLASMIGLNSHGFVADVDRFNDVWNQPVTGYSSTIEEDMPLKANDVRSGIMRRVRIKTTMIYGEELEFYKEEDAKKGELGFVSKEPVTGTPAQTYSERKYEYVLELDRSGNITGGEWISEGRPDMLWMKLKDSKFINGRFPLAGLNQIYKPIEPHTVVEVPLLPSKE